MSFYCKFRTRSKHSRCDSCTATPNTTFSRDQCMCQKPHWFSTSRARGRLAAPMRCPLQFLTVYEKYMPAAVNFLMVTVCYAQMSQPSAAPDGQHPGNGDQPFARRANVGVAASPVRTFRKAVEREHAGSAGILPLCWCVYAVMLSYASKIGKYAQFNCFAS